MVASTESVHTVIEKEDYLWLESTVDNYFLYSKTIPGVDYDAWVPVCGLIEALINDSVKNVEQRLIADREAFIQLDRIPEIQRILDIAQTFASVVD